MADFPKSVKRSASEAGAFSPPAKRRDIHFRDLHAVAREGKIRSIFQLIARGSDVNQLDGGGRTPLDCARAASQVVALKCLEKKGGYTGRDTVSFRRLRSACLNGDFELAKRVVKLCGNEVNKPLYFYKWGSTKRSRTYLLHQAATTGPAAMVKLLLMHRARIDQVDSKGRTAYECACIGGEKVAAELLLDKGSKLLTEGGGLKVQEEILREKAAAKYAVLEAIAFGLPPAESIRQQE